MTHQSYLKRIYFDSVKTMDYLGYFLLAAGLIVLGLSINNSWQTANQLAKTSTAIDEIQKLDGLKQTGEVVESDPDKLAITERIRRQNNYPWELLFSTLEMTHTSNVSLMAIQPSIDKREVLISAETANTHLMLNYIRELEKKKNIDHVELLSQEIIADNQQERLSFLIMIKLI